MSLFGKLFVFVTILCYSMSSVYGSTSRGVEDRQSLKGLFDLFFNMESGFSSEHGFSKEKSQARIDCPLCDSSVYSYCSEKLLHDACCCLNPYEHKLPYECKFADCNFLHANSCREHKLITACCCSSKVH